MWGVTLRDFILALHGVDIVWTPATQEEEPPF